MGLGLHVGVTTQFLWQFHGMAGYTYHCPHVFVHSTPWRCWPRSRNNTWWTKSARRAMEAVEISVVVVVVVVFCRAFEQGFWLHSFHFPKLMQDFHGFPTLSFKACFHGLRLLVTQKFWPATGHITAFHSLTAPKTNLGGWKGYLREINPYPLS